MDLNWNTIEFVLWNVRVIETDRKYKWELTRQELNDSSKMSLGMIHVSA